MSSYTTIFLLPTTTVRRSLLGASQLSSTCAIVREAYDRSMNATSGIPRGQLEVREDGGGDDHRVHVRVLEDAVEVPRGLDARIAADGLGERLGLEVARVLDPHVGELEEHPQEVWSPVPQANDGDAQGRCGSESVQPAAVVVFTAK